MNPEDNNKSQWSQDINNPGLMVEESGSIPKRKGNTSSNNTSVSSISRGYQNVDRMGGLQDNHLVFGSVIPNPNANALNRNQSIPFSNPFRSSKGPERPLLEKY